MTADLAEREVMLTFTWRAAGQPERDVRLATAQETRPAANLTNLAQTVETLRLTEA